METTEDPLSRLLKFLGKSWKVVSDRRGCVQLYKGDHVYMAGTARGVLFRKFATLRPMYGAKDRTYFGIPESLDSSSEEELLLKLSIMEKEHTVGFLGNS